MRLHRPLLLLAATAPLLVVSLAAAAQAVTAAPAAPESRAATVATGVAQLTGLAISPLLVLVAIGWIDFQAAGGTASPSLPVHANPWLLIPCSLVLGLTILKKFASPAMPLPIRKLFDAAEYLEAKLSALVAAGVLLPTIMSTFAAATGSGAAAAQTAGFAADWGNYLWIVPITLAMFASVWITFHIIDGLIVLSPFALLDTLLVALRASVLAVIVLALLVSPFVALILCAPIILLSMMFAGWCVRLDLFALCVATDLLFRRSTRTDAAKGPVRAFLAARELGAPIRTMGHAAPLADRIRFTYRPFFVLPRRTIDLAAERVVLVRGALWPTMHAGTPRRRLLSLPPRYGPHASLVASRFGAHEEDGVILRAWHGVRAALAAILGGGASDAAAAK